MLITIVVTLILIVIYLIFLTRELKKRFCNLYEAIITLQKFVTKENSELIKVNKNET